MYIPTCVPIGLVSLTRPEIAPVLSPIGVFAIG